MDAQLKRKELFDRCFFLKDGYYIRDFYWKLPLRVVVKTELADDMVDAIIHFVGGVDSVTSFGEQGPESAYTEIISAGYYHYIGA